MATLQTLNVTLLEPRLKHPTVFQYFDALAAGENFVIENDHDPKPLYYELLAERGNIFTWEYLEKGPEWFVVQIAKNPTEESHDIQTLDVTQLEPRMKHPTVFKYFDALAAGEAFVIENDHDPKPLYYELLAERGNIFTWEYLEQGPEWFKVKIAKNRDEKTPQNGSIPEKDLKKAAYLKEKGVIFGCSDSGPKFPDNNDYDEWELGMLADYIVATHHQYIKDNAESLNGLAIKVSEHHGENHPELHRVATSTHHFLQDLLNHITNEEEVLFPVIRQLLIKKDNPSEELSYEAGTLDHPIRILLKEHEIAGEDLNFLRRITNNFAPPKNACNSFTYLYEKLKEFESDLYIHLLIENDYLFPRALKLDEEIAATYS
ncbi:DUF2249 domain-containing protein [Chryseobacterium sp. HSC-36S06]|uniref:DUF2249 domain-containing protein n=1 Tax=Chryseobacterium sp. HSC-36S06 TaxID=2910970 RepID=UPI00209F2444|nr:DUF2249 domain-containing protein [Chryseobacterium sp. HSC-36S06]MCP2037143.1 regulator of cell morphogenesis and NO signaling [Chryseobacterium sp. HSC-36S06]